MRWLLLFGLGLLGCGSHRGVDALPTLDLATAVERDGVLWMHAPAQDDWLRIDLEAGGHSHVAAGVPAWSGRAGDGGPAAALVPDEEALVLLGQVPTVVELGGAFTRIVWDDRGRGFAWGAALGEQITVNPGAWALVDLATDPPSVRTGSLGFEPSDVLLLGDFVLATTPGRLQILPLSDPSPIAVPFSPDSTALRTPSLVVPVPGEPRVLVVVDGLTDLFVVGLDPVSIENVVDLPRRPRAVSVVQRHAVIADGAAELTAVDLDSFDVETFPLTQAVTDLAGDDGDLPHVLAWGPAGPLLMRLDFADGLPDAVRAWRLGDRFASVHRIPAQDAVVVPHHTALGASTHGLSVVDFAQTRPGQVLLADSATDPLIVDGLAGGPAAFVLIPALDRLVRYRLPDLAPTVLETWSGARSLGVIGDSDPARLFVLHDAESGFVSLVPTDATETPPGGFPAISGFGYDGLLDGGAR